MGLKRNQLIEAANRILTPELSKYGYQLHTEPGMDDLGWEFWYVNEPGNIDHLYRIISFTPSGFDDTDLFNVNVNLARWATLRGPSLEKDLPTTEISNVCLAPCLWQEGGAMDFQWHFTSKNELDEAYVDILDKLIKYGINFLNDPNSSWYTWAEGSGWKE